MPELFRLELPEEPGREVVVPFPGVSPAEQDHLPEVADAPRTAGIATRLSPVRERIALAWRTTWVGDGLLGLRPRPVADLIRQFWTTPPPYIRDALILRIPYTIYGAAAITVTAAAHLLLLVIGYPALLAAAAALTTIVVLIT